MKELSDLGWIDEVVRWIINLVNILEMEIGNLIIEQIDEWMVNLEIYIKVRYDEYWMKLWICYIRVFFRVFFLVGVQKEIEVWMGIIKGLLFYVNFYK